MLEAAVSTVQYASRERLFWNKNTFNIPVVRADFLLMLFWRKAPIYLYLYTFIYIYTYVFTHMYTHTHANTHTLRRNNRAVEVWHLCFKECFLAFILLYFYWFCFASFVGRRRTQCIWGGSQRLLCGGSLLCGSQGSTQVIKLISRHHCPLGQFASSNDHFYCINGMLKFP